MTLTPTESILLECATDIDGRIQHLNEALSSSCPGIDPIVRLRRATVMALLERDHSLMFQIEERVRVASLVKLAPDLEIAAGRNVGLLLRTARLQDATYARDPRRDFVYGSVLLFGFSVRLGENVADVEIPADIASCRCYIDGNSWIWPYAPAMLRVALGQPKMVEGGE